MMPHKSVVTVAIFPIINRNKEPLLRNQFIILKMVKNLELDSWHSKVWTVEIGLLSHASHS